LEQRLRGRILCLHKCLPGEHICEGAVIICTFSIPNMVYCVEHKIKDDVIFGFYLD